MAAFSSCLAANATTPSDTIKIREGNIDEVVVTSRHTPAKISSPTPVQTLSSADISNLGITDMADAVRRFAGTNVKDYGGIGGLKTVSVRNMGAQHTAVSYDGSPVSNSQGGQIDIGRFSLDNVGMISLAVGQTDDMLQCARLYASAAVLGISTEAPHFTDGKPFSLRLQMKGGSFGFINPSVRWWQKLGKRLTTSLEGNLLRADGNYPFTLVNGKYVTKEHRNNSDIISRHAEANIYYALAGDGSLQLKGYYFYSRRGLPGAVTLYNPVSTERLWDENAFVQLKFRKSFSEKWKLQALSKYNYGWNKDTEENPEFANGLYKAVHKQEEWFASATILWRPLPALSVALAQDGFINSLRSTMAECPTPTRYSSYSALSAKWEKSLFNVTASLVATAITERVKSGTRPDDITKLNPSLSVSFSPVRDFPLYLRAMYKNTFRVPSFNDLYYFRLGTRNLKPEKADEFNLGVTWGHSFFPAMEYLSITLDGFYNNVTDKIVAFPTTYAWIMTNYGKADIRGLDATIASSFRLPADISLTLSGAYTWQKALDVTDKNSKTYRHQLPYTPQHSGNASLLVETAWVNVGYSVTGMGKRYYLAENIPVNEIDGYAEHTLTLSRKFDFKASSLSVSAEIINLTDKQYDIIKFYPMPGRSWRLNGTFIF